MASWRDTVLGDVADIAIGRTPPRAEPRYWTEELVRPFCSISDMNGWSISPTREGITAEAEVEGKAKRVPAGALLMSFKLTIGRVGFAARDVFPNEAIAWLRVKPDAEMDERFLAHYLSAVDYSSLTGRAAKGETLNSKSLATVPLRVPPLDTQRRLVEVMERFIELDDAHGSYLQHTRTVIDTICSEAWAASDTRRPLGTLGTTLTGQTPPTKDASLWEPAAVPFVAPGDFNSLLLGSVERRVSLKGFERVRQFPANSVMQVCIGATLGKVALLPWPAAANQQVNAVLGLDASDALFLTGVLAAREGLSAVRARAGQTAIPIINKSAWSQIEVPWPSADVRTQTARVLQACIEVERSATQATMSARNLKSVLLRDCLAGDVMLARLEATLS